MDVITRNNVTVTGAETGTPIVFVHGFGCDQNMWRFVTPAFAGDHPIVLLDLVGMGRSDVQAWSPDRYATLRGYARDLLEVIDELELDAPVVVGHSVSAMIGALAAVDRPGAIGRLVLVSPSPRYIDDPPYVGGFSEADIEGLLDSLDANYLGWSTTMAPVIMGNPDAPELADELADSFCRTAPDVAAHFARITFTGDNRADLARVDVPCLVLQCTDDAIAPQVVGEYVHAHLPDSRYVLLDATGHCPNLSAPEQVVEAIADFLG